MRTEVTKFLKKMADNNLRPPTHDEAYEIALVKFLADLDVALENETAKTISRKINRGQIDKLIQLINAMIDRVFKRGESLDDESILLIRENIKITDDLLLIHAFGKDLKCQTKIELLKNAVTPTLDLALSLGTSSKARSLYKKIQRDIRIWYLSAELEHEAILINLRKTAIGLKAEINAKKKKY